MDAARHIAADPAARGGAASARDRLRASRAQRPRRAAVHDDRDRDAAKPQPQSRLVRPSGDDHALLPRIDQPRRRRDRHRHRALCRCRRVRERRLCRSGDIVSAGAAVHRRVRGCLRLSHLATGAAARRRAHRADRSRLSRGQFGPYRLFAGDPDRHPGQHLHAALPGVVAGDRGKGPAARLSARGAVRRARLRDQMAGGDDRDEPRRGRAVADRPRQSRCAQIAGVRRGGAGRAAARLAISAARLSDGDPQPFRRGAPDPSGRHWRRVVRQSRLVSGGPDARVVRCSGPCPGGARRGFAADAQPDRGDRDRAGRCCLHRADQHPGVALGALADPVAADRGDRRGICGGSSNGLAARAFGPAIAGVRADRGSFVDGADAVRGACQSRRTDQRYPPAGVGLGAHAHTRRKQHPRRACRDRPGQGTVAPVVSARHRRLHRRACRARRPHPLWRGRDAPRGKPAGRPRQRRTLPPSRLPCALRDPEPL